MEVVGHNSGCAPLHSMNLENDGKENSSRTPSQNQSGELEGKTSRLLFQDTNPLASFTVYKLVQREQNVK